MRNWVRTDYLYRQETGQREALDPENLCTYGIKCLDDSLVCILPDDLVLIGAESGVGKSELALNIALHNAMNKKRVGVYYLEGGRMEAIRRLKWNLCAQKYYNRNYKPEEYRLRMDRRLSYQSWASNQKEVYNNLYWTPIEAEVHREVVKDIDDYLLFYDTGSGFTEDDFLKSLDMIKSKDSLPLDLIIIDHLQYFSLRSNQENQETTAIMRKVKNVTEGYKTPVILISHLRKPSDPTALPCKHDYHGSSNIPKIASTGIVLASAPAEELDYKSNLYPTFIRIAKSRVGISEFMVFQAVFDLNKRKYANEYKIFISNKANRVSKTPLEEEDKPVWAKTSI